MCVFRVGYALKNVNLIKFKMANLIKFKMANLRPLLLIWDISRKGCQIATFCNAERGTQGVRVFEAVCAPSPPLDPPLENYQLSHGCH